MGISAKRRYHQHIICKAADFSRSFLLTGKILGVNTLKFPFNLLEERPEFLPYIGWKTFPAIGSIMDDTISIAIWRSRPANRESLLLIFKATARLLTHLRFSNTINVSVAFFPRDIRCPNPPPASALRRMFLLVSTAPQ